MDPRIRRQVEGDMGRILVLNASQIAAIGLKTTPVKQQTEPTVLKLLGQPNTIRRK